MIKINQNSFVVAFYNALLIATGHYNLQYNGMMDDLGILLSVTYFCFGNSKKKIIKLQVLMTKREVITILLGLVGRKFSVAQ